MAARVAPRAWRSLRICALCLVTAHCASGPAPKDHFYRLETQPPSRAREVARLPGTLEVGRFRSDAVTGERQLVYRETQTATEIQRHAYHRWVDAPPLMFQVETAAFLRAAGAAERVITPEVRVRPDYLLSGRIVRLERILEDSPPLAVLELELNITRASGAELVLQRSYREERQVDGSGVADAVRAYNAALTG